MSNKQRIGKLVNFIQSYQQDIVELYEMVKVWPQFHTLESIEAEVQTRRADINKYTVELKQLLTQEAVPASEQDDLIKTMVASASPILAFCHS